ncbi:putative Defensin-like protein [Melia azedarach]|uniref:Defensin-like protein n=1 Tax=Melia azedarach TaxID=155640 RepID=A0ACC1XYN4_MELAZ|nr:putative Defensin-like protein [Melia azedarach]
MAKSVAVFALLFAFFILFASFEARQCEERAQKWTGLCIKSSNCKKSCIKREGAVDGACHFDFPGFACFCYYKC